MDSQEHRGGDSSQPQDEWEDVFSGLSDHFPGSHFAKKQMISPFAQAKKVYGEGLGALLSQRGGRFHEDRHDLGDVPRRVMEQMPSFKASDWAAEVPVGQLQRHRQFDGASGVTSSIGLGTPEFVQAIAISGQPSLGQAGRTTDSVIDHEMSHAIKNAKLNRWDSVGPDIMERGELLSASPDGYLEQNYRQFGPSRRRDEYFEGLRELEEIEGFPIKHNDSKRAGFDYARRNDNESMANLNEAVRKFGSEFGRPPETEQEVIQALDLYMKEALLSGDHHTEGIIEFLKRTPWALRIGRYLVKNETSGNQEASYV